MKNNSIQRSLNGGVVPKKIVLREGYIPDLATKKPVDGRKPEEPVRQEYEKTLHDDYGYKYEQLDIEVAIQRGAKSKNKQLRDWADIVIYKTDDKTKRDQNRDILGIVETKRPQREDGVRQLMSYMSASSALWGVWYNGSEVEYVYKDQSTGEVKRNFIFQIPPNGYTLEDVGNLSKKDLRPAKNLKVIFKRILNILYANTNISRREKLGSEMIRLIFCKIWDEKLYPELPPKFKIGIHDSPDDVKRNIESLFEEVKEELVEDGVFDANEKILIDSKSVAYVVGELQQFSLMLTDKDVVGDAFEVFAESKFVGEKGEFFTPREVVKMCVDIIDPQPEEKVLDPACGSGGFLIYALEHVWRNMGTHPKYKGVKDIQMERKKIAERNYFGIDKEIDLVKIAKAYMAIVGDGRGSIIQENTLHNYQDWNSRSEYLFLEDKKPKKFDVILTNPPFGAKIKVIDDDTLKNFDLGHKWRFDKYSNKWFKTKEIQKTEPQLLFIERCLDFLKEGGRMAIVLPDGVFGNPTDGWVRQWIRERAEILAIVDNPPDTFMPHTHTKTSVLFLRKWKDSPRVNYPIFCGIVNKCGHDARGNDIRREDGEFDEEFSEVSKNYWNSTDRVTKKWERKGFTLYESKLINDILIPRYYNPDTQVKLKEIESTGEFELKTVSQLVNEGLVKVKGAGGTARPSDYGTGNIPFVRTSEISNWEISHDVTHKVAEDIYLKFKERQDLRENDILFVKDGTFLIGDTALVTKYDLDILVQSHFLIIRSLDWNKIHPLLLLYLLNTSIVRVQIDEKTFVQATLSTIGNRLNEIYLPIPKSEAKKEEYIEAMNKVVERARLIHEIKRSLT